jgi:dipeptidyl aminopeptidase/acylaminoacyl peptidase
LQKSEFVSRSSGAAGLLLAWALALLALPVGAEPAPVADFFKPDAYSDLIVSPSGKRMCAIIPRANGRLTLAVLDLDDPAKSKIVAGYRDADVWGAQWVNDDRLVFRIFDQREGLANQRGTGLFAVDAQGSQVPRMLVRPQSEFVREATNIKSRALERNHGLHSVLRDGSNDVIVDEYFWGASRELKGINLKRVDTVTGEVRGLSQGAPEGAVDWTLDGAGRPRVVLALQGAKEVLYWKATPDAEWSKIEESDIFSARRSFEPIYVDANNRLYASARTSAKEDTNSLTVVEMSAGKADPRALLSAEGYDIHGSLVLSGAGAVLGVHYLTDARATVWFDAGMKKIQGQVDALLPGTINRLDCGNCDPHDKTLVMSYSDRQPGIYRVFDSRSGKLESLAEARPWIVPKTMAARDMVRIDTRDGMSMPVHVTRPVGQKGPLPAVVLVHGGPWVRGGEWQWEPQSQFLASRGYVVIEPEFRGSAGFGFKHFRSSWKQWGLTMQDDVADAAQWAIRQGYADPKRVCIAGASYGGYATLMGLIRNPELFRCGVEWVGVTDIDLMYSITWSDASDRWTRYGMPRMVGDRKQDAAQLAATSPIKLADKVTQPLLMAYGGVDQRVPIDHGTQFRDAVRKTNPQVEWVVYADEGHGWLLPANNIDFWTRVERFLDKNLKNAP